jgi:hypothetical protein
MAQLKKSAVTLRIIGDDLVPEEITKLLGIAPTHARKKGEKWAGPKTGRVIIAKFGTWQLRAADHEPENVDAQIQEILSQTTGDLAVWRSITEKQRVDLFCSLFMAETNEGLAISPRSLTALTERGIELSLDIYAPTDD